MLRQRRAQVVPFLHCRAGRFPSFRSLAPLALLAGALISSPAALAQAPGDDGQVENPVSQFPIIVDGLFTGGVSGGQIVGEWSDVAPLAFISPTSPGGTLVRTTLEDPLRNSLLYAGIAPGTTEGGLELYLMYDYLPRTNTLFAPGEFIADIRFPVTLPPVEQGAPPRDNQFITVQFRGGGVATTGVSSAIAAIPGVAVLVDINGDGIPDTTASALGMDGAVGFGPSTLSALDHLLVELEVPLRIPAQFGDLDRDGNQDPNEPFPPAGINPATGLYDPDPAFWGANIAKNDVDPPASAAIFQILPNGTTVANSTAVPLAGEIPEPSSLLLLGSGGLLGLTGFCRRRRA